LCPVTSSNNAIIAHACEEYENAGQENKGYPHFSTRANVLIYIQNELFLSVRQRALIQLGKKSLAGEWTPTKHRYCAGIGGGVPLAAGVS
jgi:hypothetical protein